MSARPQRRHSGPQVDPGTSDGGQQKPVKVLNASRKFRSPPGLVNLGNTCFINSLAQCLLANKGLASFVPSCVGKALEKLQGHNAFSGQAIRRTELVRAITLQNPSLTSGEQHDAAEALEAMLTGNHNSAVHSEQGSGEAAAVISYVACGSRSATSRALVPSIIQVPVTASSLNLCPSNLAPQPLESRRCEQCQAVSNVLSIQIHVTPQVMALHLLLFHITSQVKKHIEREAHPSDTPGQCKLAHYWYREPFWNTPPRSLHRLHPTSSALVPVRRRPSD